MSGLFEEYIIRIKYKNEFRNVYIKANELTVQDFLIKAFNAFQIKPNGNVKVFLKDNVGIAIPKEKLLDHVKAFWRNGAFFIDVSYEGDSNSQTVDIITPVMFGDYLKEVNELQLLIECKGKNEKDVLSRQKIIQAAVDFMISIFGENVSMFHRQATANALVHLFPFIGYQNGQQIGIQTLLNGSNGGWLNNRYYYVRNTRRKQAEIEKIAQAMANGNVPAECSVNNYDPQKDVEQLKQLVINNDNLTIFEEKLNLTRDYRAEMMKRPETEIKEHFPYFHTHPMIFIPLEFDLKYKEKAVQSDGLLENWATYKPKLDRVLEHHKKSAFETEWASNVDDFFVLLQLFPSKQVGRNVTANLKNFEASVDKLVQFELMYTPPTEMARESQSYPKIIACGSSKKEIEYFCLKLEGKLVPLPGDATFIDAFDIFFKVHKIFDFNYEPTLRNMMTFVENYIYKLEGEHTPTNRMADISQYLNRDS